MRTVRGLHQFTIVSKSAQISQVNVFLCVGIERKTSNTRQKQICREYGVVSVSFLILVIFQTSEQIYTIAQVNTKHQNMLCYERKASWVKRKKMIENAAGQKTCPGKQFERRKAEEGTEFCSRFDKFCRNTWKIKSKKIKFFPKLHAI